jgi:anti-sigma regulatory factor (Ser/Thr protein kinase)
MEVASAVITISEQTDVAEARRRAAERAANLGFDTPALGRVAIVVTEAGTNLLKHAGGGELVIGPAPGRGAAGLQVLALDRGPGMNVDMALRDGYSTSGTAGTGLGAIARAATSFDVYSSPGRGTVVVATVYPAAAEPLPIGAVSVAMRGQDVSGDAWAVWAAGELTSVFVSDGLGHGDDAAAASALALATFRRHAERSAPDVISAVHDALRATRGAAVAIAELDHRQHTLRYCGLGNISAAVVTPDGATQHLVSLAGIAGHVMRRVQPFSYAWPPGSTLLMHSDGIATHWSMSQYPGVLSRRADVVAAVMLRDHRRLRDDATVVSCRNGELS